MTRPRADHRSLPLGIITLLLTVSGGTLADAQQGGSTVTIDIGSAEGPPSSVVSIAISLTIPADVAIRRFEQDIRFENRWLSYVVAEISPEGTGAGLEVTASADTDSRDRSYSILRLKATSQRPLASGAVMNLTFAIDKLAEPGARTVLQNKTRIRREGSDRMSEIEGKDGQVTVTPAVLIPTCFFYMH
jgi:hypothetical protein